MPEAAEYVRTDGRSPFSAWFSNLESRAAARVTRVVVKLRDGLRPDVEPVGQSVFEAKIDYGPGYRVYFAFDGPALVILLGGGDKRTQRTDIAAAKAAWADYGARKAK